MIIRLAKPLVYCDATHTEINLDLDRLTGADSMAVTRELRAKHPKEPVIMAEMDDRYLVAMAARASGIEEAALCALPLRVFGQVKMEVQGFLLGAASEATSPES